MEYYQNPKEITFTAPGPSADFLDYFTNDAKILDLGCGYGRTLAELKDLGFSDLHGVDISEVLVERAKVEKVTKSENLHASDLLSFSPSTKYTHILIVGVIEYFTSYAERTLLIKKIKELLEPNGYVYLATFLRNDDYNHLYQQNKDKPWGTLVTSAGITLFHDNIEGINSLFDNDFALVKSEETMFETWTKKSTPGYRVLYKLK